MRRDWLIAYRKAKELSQEEIANMINVSPSAYSTYENGTRTPRPKIAKLLANIFHFNWTIFYDDDLKKNT